MGLNTAARPPKDDVFRAASSLALIRAEGDDTELDGETLSGHFAVFNQWTEINSWEGNFLERVAPGAAKRTIRESQDQMRVLLQHGYDPELGEKPIADITDLREDETGVYYEARMLEGVPPLVLAGLRAGLYGASFRFGVVREEWNDAPDPSEHNPRGLPERTLTEIRVREFGPVTWGAYPDATAELAGEGMRSLEAGESLMDEYLIERLVADPTRLERAVQQRTAHLAAFSGALAIVGKEGPELVRSGDATSVAPAEPEADAEDEASRDAGQPGDTGAPDATGASGDTPAPIHAGRDYLHGGDPMPSWHLS